MLKSMTFDEAFSDNSMIRSRSTSPKEDVSCAKLATNSTYQPNFHGVFQSRYSRRNGVMIASVTKVPHNEPASFKESNNSSYVVRVACSDTLPHSVG
jgi:hypothetical protein